MKIKNLVVLGVVTVVSLFEISAYYRNFNKSVSVNEKKVLFQEALKQVDYNKNNRPDFYELRDLGVKLKVFGEDEVFLESNTELSDRIRSDVDFDVLEKFVVIHPNLIRNKEK